jgi:hemerythrin-like domain-containing protein
LRFGSASPLALFSECHARTLEQCVALRDLELMLRRTGWSTQARHLSLEILRHFDSDAVQNHEEEEACLFPALLESTAGCDDDYLRRMTSELAGEHGRLERMWSRLRLQLEAIASGEAAKLCRDDVEAFVESNARHIANEEGRLLPMAGRLISGTELPRLRARVQAKRSA